MLRDPKQLRIRRAENPKPSLPWNTGAILLSSMPFRPASREPDTWLNKAQPQDSPRCTWIWIKTAIPHSQEYFPLILLSIKDQQSVTVLYLRCAEMPSFKELNLPSFFLGKLLLLRCSNQLEACAKPPLPFYNFYSRDAKIFIPF